MTLAMDGVRKVSAPLSMPVILARPKGSATVSAAMPRRYITGMDGIRRPVPLTPREMLAGVARDEPVEETMVAAPLVMPELATPAAMAAVLPARTWHLPSLSLSPALARPIAAFGLVATALVASGFAVHAIATPSSTAAHAEAAPAAPAPSVAPAVVAPQNTGLQQLLDQFAAANPDKFGIVVKNLKTGEVASVNADHQITSASLYKLFVAQRIYQRIDIGQLDYGKPAGGGTGRNVEQCLTIMINISDNGCGRALGAILGWSNQDQALRLEGYGQTTLASPQQTSAGDVATMLERLYGGTLLSPASSDRFMGLLKDQRVNNRLPVGLPAGTVIAHKTGDLDGVVHDAGIVYGPKANYIVVVTSGPWKTPGIAPAMFADLSNQLWNHIEQ